MTTPKRKPTTNPLLLKTKSTPSDGYDEFFSARDYHPAFIPVLEHHFHEENLQFVRRLFEHGQLTPGPGRKYGGIIFTSQRAVEAFARVVTGDVGVELASEASKSLTLYTVGPATSRSLSSLQETHLRHATIHGHDAGTGEVLAHMILDHYNSLPCNNPQSHPQSESASEPEKKNLPLLFLVGEQRRDVIPKTLMSDALRPTERIPVDEVVVYETGVMGSFEADFQDAVRTYRESRDNNKEEDEETIMWVVVFSPTGCDAMLRVLGLGSFRGGDVDDERRIFVATIGPTTRDHLREKYGFEADVCAEKPSPEGVGRGIEMFMERWRGQRGP